MSGALPEEPVRRPVVYQSWRHMTFLHWDYDPAVIRALLPDGLEPDLHKGRAWVGMTPFLVEGFRLPLVPPIPKLSDFPETNLRTYVQGEHGDGLWFLTLEVASIATVIGARLGYGVPYRLAEMSVEPKDGFVRYRSQRDDVGYDITVRPGGPLEDNGGEFDHWLAGRWRAYTRIAGRLASVAVRHQTWPLQSGAVESIEQNVLESCGLPAPDGEPIVHCSAGVDARLGPPRFV